MERIDEHYVIREIGHVLHADKGFFYTIKKLLTSQGDSVRDYITKDRSRYIKHVMFLVFAALIYTLVKLFFHIEYED